MFVYEKQGNICVTFASSTPIENPEYVITIDKENEKLVVNGNEIEAFFHNELNTDTEYSTAQVIDSNLVVLLNGYKISIPEDTAGDGVFHVKSGGNLIIDGSGIVDGVGKNDYNMAIWADGGNVTINGGLFTNKGASGTNDPSHFDLIYAKNGSVVEINGGYFECETPQWTLNNHDSKPGKFVVKGGTFIGFDPSCTKTEPSGANNNFVAEGYGVVRDGNKYTVVKL